MTQQKHLTVFFNQKKHGVKKKSLVLDSTGQLLRTIELIPLLLLRARGIFSPYKPQVLFSYTHVNIILT